jgi:GT2 family glycosyltransferase/2-polyprenyl-3-methyl-5-hydroxy-6-metoxy-1,4-benzoquinol methylase
MPRKYHGASRATLAKMALTTSPLVNYTPRTSALGDSARAGRGQMSERDSSAPLPYSDPRAFDPPPDTSWGKLLALVPRDGRVLDVGCAGGSFSSAMHRLRGCTVTGVELDPILARSAREHCAEVIEGDVAALGGRLPRDFDAVIAADVLEHLVDPAAALRSLASALKPGGVLLASIPNVTHASIVLALAAGSFPRSDEGLLDKTHLRFFGEGEVLSLFHEAGFAASVVDRVSIDPRLTEFKSDLLGLPEAVISFLGQNPNADTYQFIVRAVPRQWARPGDDQEQVRSFVPVSAASLKAQLEGLHGELRKYHEALSSVTASAKETHGLLGAAREQLGAKSEELGLRTAELSRERERATRADEAAAAALDRADLAEDAREAAAGKREARRLRLLGALPLAGQDRLRVLYVTSRDDAPFRYRCLHACEQLRASGIAANIARLEDPGLVEQVPHYSLVVLFRLPFSPLVEGLIEAARKSGATVGFDIDDLIFDPRAEEWMPFLKQFPAERVEAYRRDFAALRETMHRVSFCIAATPTIARHARQLGLRGFVHPNLLAADQVRLSRVIAPLRKRLLDGPLVAYLSGSNTHDGDLASIAQALLDAFAQRPELRLLIVGHARTPQLLRPLQEDRVIRVGYQSHQLYPWLMARCSAVLAPLEQLNDFTNAKSALKVFEAGSVGVATIASPSVQYGEAIEPAVSGFLCSTQAEWTAALLRVCDRETSLALGARAREIALQDYSADAYRHALSRKLLAEAGRAALAAMPARTPLGKSVKPAETLRLIRESARLALKPVVPTPSDEAYEAASAGPAAAADAGAWIAAATQSKGQLFAGETRLGRLLAGRDQPLGGWQGHGVRPRASASPGCAFEALTEDPSFIVDRLRFETQPTALFVEMSARAASAGSTAQLFWRERGGAFREGWSVKFPVLSDGASHAYLVPLEQGTRKLISTAVDALRFDPLSSTGEFEVTKLALLEAALPEGQPELVRALRERFPQAVAVAVPPGPLGQLLAEPLRALPPHGCLFLSLPEGREIARRAVEEACAGLDARLRELQETQAGVVAIVCKQGSVEPSQKLDVVVPIYNARELTRRCVESVLAYAGPSVRVVLIDDASPDQGVRDDLRAFAARDPRVLVLLNEKNLGFVGTANRGMRHAAGRDVLLLNSDTEVFAGFVEQLQATACTDEHTGIVTPFSNNATIYSVPEFGDNPIPEGYTPASLANLVSLVSRRLRPQMPTAVGFCMYVKAEVLAQVGYFDEETFGRGFGEENDLCQRARAKGFTVRLCDDAFVWHKGKASFGDAGRELEKSNELLLRQKHPSYGPEIAHFFRVNPLLPLHRELRFHLARLREGARGCALFVVHSSPFRAAAGGTEHHVLDLLRALALPRAVVAYPEGSSLVAAEVLEGKVESPSFFRFGLQRAPLQFCLEDEELQEIVRHWVDLFGIRWAHLHHLLSWPVALGRTLQDKGVPYVFTVHDYYAVSPSWNLFDFGTGERCTCAEPDGKSAGCLPAFFQATGLALPKGIDAGAFRQAHRAAWLSTLQGARAIISPSGAARDVLLKHLQLPGARLEVVPHGRDAAQPASRTPPAPRLRIGILGEISYPLKGARKYLELIESCRGLPIDWHFFGNVDRFGYRERLTSLNLGERLHLHGAYEREAIVGRLAAEGIDACLLLPEWDETFSYTVSEAVLAGVPVIVSDRGAPAERVRSDGIGFVVDSVADCRLLLARICQDRELLAPALAKVRASGHRTIAQSAAQHRELYASLGFGSRLDAELRREWLHELSDRSAALAIASPEASAPVAQPKWLRRLEPALGAVRPFLPQRFRRAGKALVKRIIGRPVVVLNSAANASRTGLRLLGRDGAHAKFESQTTDPQLVFSIRPVDSEQIKELRFSLKREGNSFAQAQFFWASRPQDGFSEERSATIQLDGPAGEWHQYRLRLDGDGIGARWRSGRVAHLRFDPIDQPGIIELGRIELLG